MAVSNSKKMSVVNRKALILVERDVKFSAQRNIIPITITVLNQSKNEIVRHLYK